MILVELKVTVERSVWCRNREE